MCQRATSQTTATSNIQYSSEEWIPLFDDPILAQSALDRLAHNALQVVIDGESYRSRRDPVAHPLLTPGRRKRP